MEESGRQSANDLTTITGKRDLIAGLLQPLDGYEPNRGDNELVGLIRGIKPSSVARGHCGARGMVANTRGCDGG